MKITKEITLSEHEAWSGAKETQEAIINAGMEKEFDALIEELYPEGLDETKLNDILWFDADWCFEMLGITEEEEEEEEHNY